MTWWSAAAIQILDLLAPEDTSRGRAQEACSSWNLGRCCKLQVPTRMRLRFLRVSHARVLMWNSSSRAISHGVG